MISSFEGFSKFGSLSGMLCSPECPPNLANSIISDIRSKYAFSVKL